MTNEEKEQEIKDLFKEVIDLIPISDYEGLLKTLSVYQYHNEQMLSKKAVSDEYARVVYVLNVIKNYYIKNQNYIKVSK